MHIEAEAHSLPLDRAGAVGLVVNELPTNALKYAFPENRAGTIRIKFHREGADYVLSVTDDGVGLAQGVKLDVVGGKRRSGGLGRRLVRALAAQLGGRIEAQDRTHAGTAVTLRFPVLAASAGGGTDERTSRAVLSA